MRVKIEICPSALLSAALLLLHQTCAWHGTSIRQSSDLRVHLQWCGRPGSREEHHVKVYAGKETEEVVKAPHPRTLLRGSLVSPSLEAAIMNAKYVNAVPLYRQEQEFERYGLHIPRQNMANWTIQCADRYLAVLYDYLHEKMYGYHVLACGCGAFTTSSVSFPAYTFT